MYANWISAALTNAAAALVLAFVAHAENLLTGPVRVVDGDTLVLGERHIRLEGIDAPETDQVCLDTVGRRWTCGITARDYLAAYIAGQDRKSTRLNCSHRCI